MGLNWSEGLAGLSKGLGAMAQDQLRKEDEEIAALRADNMARLHAQLSTDSQKELLAKKNEYDIANDGRTADRAETHDTNMERMRIDATASSEKRYFGHLKQMELLANNKEASAQEREVARNKYAAMSQMLQERRDAAKEAASITAQIDKTLKGDPSYAIATPAERAQIAASNPEVQSLRDQQSAAAKRAQDADYALTMISNPGSDTPGEFKPSGNASDAFTKALQGGAPSPYQFGAKPRSTLIPQPPMPGSQLIDQPQ
jgi:hypothetical protein